MKKLNIIFALVGLVLLNACSSTTSITQRRYNKGFNFEFSRVTKGIEYEKQGKVAASQKVKEQKITQNVETITSKELLKTEEAVSVTISEKPVLSTFNFKSTNAVFNEKQVEIAALNNASLSEKEVRKAVLNNKKAIKAAINSKSNSLIDDTLLYVLLILLVPFGTTISMYLYEGSSWTQRVTINLILTLLCGLPGIIHALVVILGGK